ncbi:hypothetical protein [Sulfurivirga sp.]|uniref:DUF4870 family protein n=1 Tax=Sulfurivirga sp. TaxID=2614236 RepID=UPI0025DD5205|nr:hypothetical protein [Sulfurivirga sp.]
MNDNVSPTPDSAPSTEVTPAPATQSVSEDSLSWARIIYFLYLGGLVVGISALVGIVMAYVKRKEAAGTWLESHYRFQIATFWYGLLYMVVGAITSAFIIGWFVILWWLIWLIVRCVRGLDKLGKQEPISGGFFSLGE